jgi:hypothetical protein
MWLGEKKPKTEVWLEKPFICHKLSVLLRLDIRWSLFQQESAGLCSSVLSLEPWVEA